MEPQFFINMKDIPTKGSPNYDSFFQRELEKIRYGVTIDGIYIHGWLYWHLNHWHIMLDELDPVNNEVIRKFTNPSLRDNEWFFQEKYLEAEINKKGLCIIGTRRFSKSVIEASFIGRAATIYEGSENVIVGNNKDDLAVITSLCDKGLNALHEYFKFGRIGDDWKKEVSLGFKNKQGTRHEWSKIFIRNTDGGTTTEVVAGTTPKSLIYDEIGKCLKNDSSLYTENGIIQIKDVKVGDYIYGDDGELTKVLNVFSQPKKPLYKITLGDGRTVSCCKDHIWRVWDTSLKREVEITTEKILQNPYLSNNSKRSRYFIPVAKAIKYKKKKLLIPPYLLGAWLGDGSTGSTGFTNIDKELLKFVRIYANNLKLKVSSYNKKAHSIINRQGSPNLLKNYFKHYNILNDKRIPEEYFLSSISDRILLLKGIMDTDGSVSKTGIIELSLSKLDLAKDVERLLRELGISFKCKLRNTFYIKDGKRIKCKDSMRFSIYTNINIFNLQRKQNNYLHRTTLDKATTSYKKHLSYIKQTPIKSIEYDCDDYSTCIIVDNKSKCFLTNDCIVTHNSQFLEVFAAAQPSFASPYGWRATPLLVGCLTAGNKVFTKDGNLINIENLKQSDGIIGFNKEIQDISYEDITHINPPQNKQCYKITTNKGSTIECSFDHPILVKHRDKYEKGKRKLEFLNTELIKEGMYLSLPDSIPLLGTLSMENPYYIGAIIGDGNYSSDRGVRFYNEDDEIWEYLSDIGKEFVIFKSYTTSKNRLYREARIKGSMNQLKELGIYGQSKEQKDLPDNIHLYNEKDVCELIAGLFDTDGCVIEGKNNYVFLSSSSEKMIDSLKLLLLRLGIHSNKQYIKPDKRDRKIKSKNGYFNLNILDRQSILIFCNKIPLKIIRKKEKLEKLKVYFKNKKSQIDSNYKGLRFERIIKVEKTGDKPVYNLTTSDTHTYLANGIVTHNTGGDFENGKDAEKMFNDPDSYNMVSMLLPEEGNKKTCIFVPGTYSLEFPKIKTTLGDYLNIENKDSELYMIPFYYSDHTINKGIIMEKRTELAKAKDSKELLKYKMYYPLTSDECFLTETGNDFPIEAAIQHLEYINRNTNLHGTPTKLIRTVDGSIEAVYDESRKIIWDYPHENGTNLDAPICIFEPPIKNAPAFLYIAGSDPYNQDTSVNSPSLGSLYIYKRMYDPIGGTFQNRIVASYVARPATMKEWHETAELLLEYYNATVMIENAGTNFIQFLDSKNKGHILADGYSLLKEISYNTSITGRTKGLPPTPSVIKYCMNLLIDYCKEEIMIGSNPDGSPIMALGIVRITDPILLKEMIAYKKGANVDRIVAFRHILAYDRYLEKIYAVVEMPSTSDTPKKQKPQIRSPFSLQRNNPFT